MVDGQTATVVEGQTATVVEGQTPTVVEGHATTVPGGLAQNRDFDYRPGSDRSDSARGSSGVQVDATRALVGKQILSVLRSAKDKTDTVYSLVDRLRLDISTVLAICDYLESTGFIIVTRDNYGNHTLRLTDAGEAWMS